MPRIVAMAAGAMLLLAGVWAFVAPASFFEQVAAFEPYNVHFIRDLGAFQIGLGAVLLLAAYCRDALLVALAGVGIGALFHLLSHVIDRDLGGQPAVDFPFFTLVALALVVGVRGVGLRRWGPGARGHGRATLWPARTSGAAPRLGHYRTASSRAGTCSRQEV